MTSQLLTILIKPNKVLNEVAKEVSLDELKDSQDFIDSMVRTMVEAPAAGLAAPQVGVGKRIMVYINDGKPEVLINPVIVSKKKKTPSKERCLSVKKDYIVHRYKYVKVAGLNREGKYVAVKGRGFLSLVLQHEIDHLDGITIEERAMRR